MRKFIFALFMGVALVAYSQDSIPVQPRLDVNSGIKLKDSVFVEREGTEWGKSKYTELYNVVTDSMVYTFGLEFTYDSVFVKRVEKGKMTRKTYDMFKTTTQQVLNQQEDMRKETIEFLNRYKTSPEVWFLFQVYKLLK